MAGKGRNSVYLTVGAPYTSDPPCNKKSETVPATKKKSDYLLEEIGAQRSVYATEPPKTPGKAKPKPRKLVASAIQDAVDDVAIMEKKTPKKKSTLTVKDENDAKPPVAARTAPSTTPAGKTSAVRAQPSKTSKDIKTADANGKKIEVRKKSTEQKNVPRQKKTSKK